MKITKDDLKKMIAEEMANEGILDMFGLGSGDKEAAQRLGRNLYLKIRNADRKGELDKFITLRDHVNTVALDIQRKDIQRKGFADDPRIVKYFGKKGKLEGGMLEDALQSLLAKKNAADEESARAADAEAAERRAKEKERAEEERLEDAWREDQKAAETAWRRRGPDWVSPEKQKRTPYAAEGKITKSELEQIIKEELEAVLGESDLGLEGYNVKYDSLRPGTGDPMWDQDGKLVAWQSTLHTDLLKRCAGAGEAWSEKCKEYLKNDKGI